MENLLAASAVTQATAVREKSVSSEELIEAHLQRIARVNPALNAAVQLDADGALASARAADAHLASGADLGPLHGVPFTAKDWLETEGLISAGGFAERANYVPKRDATVVARMRGAGAILLGKTNVSETNEVYGPTHNPYRAGRSPGASSSGEAAIIAAGGSPIGLGSDSGGSLRYPAHCCGIATLKPTTGRVPLTGHFPRIGQLHDPRTVIGPMARHVEDLWPALNVIAGPDYRDPSVAPVPLLRSGEFGVGRSVGWFIDMPGAEPSTSTRSVVASAIRVLSDQGARVEEVALPRIEESMALTKMYWSRVESGPSWNEWRPPRPSTLTADEIERSLFEWDRFRRAMLAFIQPFDAIVCPAAERAAPLHGAIAAQDYIYTLPFSLTGWPAVVLRAGSDSDGMPIGVQIVARPWHEADAIAVATVIEAGLGGYQPPR